MHKKTISVLIVIMMLGVLSAGGCGLFGGDQASPESAMEAFMKAMGDQDVETLSALTGEDAEEFNFEGFDALKSYSIEEINITDEENAEATVSVELEEDGYELSLNYIFYLTELEGDWFVTDADIDLDWEDLELQLEDMDIDDIEQEQEQWEDDWDEEDWDEGDLDTEDIQ